MKFHLQIATAILLYCSAGVQSQSISIPVLNDVGNILEGILDSDLIVNLTLDDSLIDILELLNATISLGIGCLDCSEADITPTFQACLNVSSEVTSNIAVAAVSTVICVYGECNGLGLLNPLDCPPGGCDDPSSDGPVSKRRKRQADPLSPLFEYVDIIACRLLNPVVASVLALSLDTLVGIL